MYKKVIHIYIYIFFLRVFFHIGYYKILDIVPCAIQFIFIAFFVYSSVFINTVLLIYPPTLFPLVAIILYSISVSIFL